jgi:ribonuclease E
MSAAPSFGETQPPVVESADTTETQGERQGRRRNRRGGRGGRERDEARVGEAGSNDSVEAPTEETMAAMDAGGLAASEGRTDEASSDEAPRPEGGEGRRRGRGRERGRREPMAQDGTSGPDDDRNGEAAPAFGRTERSDVQGMALLPTAAVQPIETVSALAAPDLIPSGTAPQPMEVAATGLAAPIEPFVLPLGTLEAVAEAAGLQWINSDADKIRAVQEAMANEPAPVRVPRERKAPVVIDEGPLVLVETRKDLSQFKLPFETVSQETQGRA